MREISLHILDIVQNSLAAGAANVTISVKEDLDDDVLELIIEDNGCGMDEEKLKKVLDPFYTTRTTRKVGLGLSMLQANAEACGGELTIDSVPNKGTVVKAVFQHSHIDRVPLGDMVATLIALVAGYPEVDFLYSHSVDKKDFIFSTKEIRDVLEDTSLDHPEVLSWLKDYLSERENQLQLGN